MSRPRDERALVRRVSDIRSERVRWLWPGYLPFGKLVVLDGDPAQGKSTLCLDIAARLSAGAPLPLSKRLDSPCDVVVLTAEDGLADTVRPRLEAASADLARIHIIDGVLSEGEIDRPIVLPSDLHLIEETAIACGARLIIIDVLNAFLSGSVDTYRDQDVRRALTPLAQSAARTGAVFITIRHLSKSGGAHALYRGGGSVGIIAAARIGLLAASCPGNDAEHVLAQTKNNLAQLAPSLRYRLVSDDRRDCGRIEWIGESEHNASALLQACEPQEEPTAVTEACDVLRQILQGGPRRARDVTAELREAGIAQRTAARAKAQLGVRSIKRGGPGEQHQAWVWALPGDSPTPEERQPIAKDASVQAEAAFGDIGILPDSPPVCDACGITNRLVIQPYWTDARYCTECCVALEQTFDEIGSWPPQGETPTRPEGGASAHVGTPTREIPAQRPITMVNHHGESPR